MKKKLHAIPFPPSHKYLQDVLLGTEIIRIMAPDLRETGGSYRGNIINIFGIINGGLQWALGALGAQRK